jgi:hypothetical protein
MWTKDDYQEHMLGYLSGVQADIERLGHSSLQRHDLNEFYIDFDIASERLWWLIESSDTKWEEFRYPLEASCDVLLRSFDSVPYPDTLTTSFYQVVSENHETGFQSLKPMEWRFSSKARSGK